MQSESLVGFMMLCYTLFRYLVLGIKIRGALLIQSRHHEHRFEEDPHDDVVWENSLSEREAGPSCAIFIASLTARLSILNTPLTRGERMEYRLSASLLGEIPNCASEDVFFIFARWVSGRILMCLWYYKLLHITYLIRLSRRSNLCHIHCTH